MKGNPYFHVAYGFCKDNNYVKAAIPPHRSQEMELYLTTDKLPDRNVVLSFKIKLYKWASNKNKTQGTDLLGELSDSTVLHYNRKHEPYWPMDEFEILNKKESAVLPSKGIYLLTEKDRELYTLTAETNEITKQRDTTLTIYKNYQKKKAKVVTVPVVVHNNSNDTLRFYSMTCSWDSFFGTNNTGIGINSWPCDKNIPDVIEVLPHGTYKTNLPITYDLAVKSGNKYRVSMSLLKVPDENKLPWGFRPFDYVRFNKIWSNEISIQ